MEPNATCRRDVFHAGEIAVQERAGERAIAASRESIIRRRLNDAANAFVESQGVVAVAAAAADGTLWASLWVGEKGLLRGSAAGDRLTVVHDAANHFADAVRPIARPKEPLGMLVIDLETRRRLRINGVVQRSDSAALEVEICEALGNCPKYIQRRVRAQEVVGVSESNTHLQAEYGVTLDDQRRSLIARIDTMFVASIHREHGIDVSHRGGTPGFTRILDDRAVRIPDYPGNSLFQTLGNFELDSRCGVAFIDFERQRILTATGRAVIDFGSEDAAQPTGGTGRYWSFTVDRWVEFSMPSTTRWVLVERSPFNPR